MKVAQLTMKRIAIILWVKTADMVAAGGRALPVGAATAPPAEVATAPPAEVVPKAVPPAEAVPEDKVN